MWTLHNYGHGDAHVLDGGIQSWLANGASLTDKTASPEELEYRPDRPGDAIARSADVLGGIGDGRTIIIDSRSPEEYSARDPHGSRPGHIPGAIHVE